MLFFDEREDIILLEDITSHVPSEYYWIFDLEMEDYTLTNIVTLEEITSPSVTVDINGFMFTVPSYWNVLVADSETSELDVVSAGMLAGRNFEVVIFGHDMNRVEMMAATVVDYSANDVNVAISMDRRQMLCHPISSRQWIHLSPSDSYNKFLKGKLVGDLYE